MSDALDVALRLLPAAPTLMAGALGYFFGKKNKQDRVINDFVIIDKLDSYKKRHDSPAVDRDVDRDIEDSQSRLHRSLDSLRRPSHEDVRDKIAIGPMFLFCIAMALIAYIPPSDTPVDDHPIMGYSALALMVISALLGVVWIPWVVLDFLSWVWRSVSVYFRSK